MGDFDVPISDKAMEEFWSLSNLAMPENSEKAADNEKVFGALLTNLSKAFDCNDHKILIARLFQYRVSPSAVNLIHSYLTNKSKRRVNPIKDRGGGGSNKPLTSFSIQVEISP